MPLKLTLATKMVLGALSLAQVFIFDEEITENLSGDVYGEGKPA